MCKNEQKPQMGCRVLTYGDFKTKFTEEKTRKILEDEDIKINGVKLSSEEIEEEINITYYNSDTDFSQDFLSHTKQKRQNNQDNNK